MWFIVERVQQHHQQCEELLACILHAPSDGSAVHRARTLLDRGCVDVNRGHGTVLPLHAACYASQPALVKLLLEYAADANQQDGYGRVALHYAAERCAQCVAVLLRRPNRNAPAHSAPDSHMPATLRTAQCDVNARDLNGNTPLHWAAYVDRCDCVAELLQAGADVDATNATGDTALSWAAVKGHYSVMQALIEHNCRADMVNVNGASALSRLIGSIAIGIGSTTDLDCLRLLIDAQPQIRLSPEVREQCNEDAALAELVLPLVDNARSLQQLCRCAIRRSLGAGIELRRRVGKLPVPTPLHLFLMLQPTHSAGFTLATTCPS